MKLAPHHLLRTNGELGNAGRGPAQENQTMKRCAFDVRLVTSTAGGMALALAAGGDCIRVEAREVHLEPGETLDDNWVLEADVRTLN